MVAAVHVEEKMMILPMREVVAGVAAVVKIELSLVGKKFHMQYTTLYNLQQVLVAVLEEVVEAAEVEAEVVQPFLSCFSPVHYVTKEITQWLLLQEEEEVVVVVVVVAPTMLG